MFAVSSGAMALEMALEAKRPEDDFPKTLVGKLCADVSGWPPQRSRRCGVYEDLSIGTRETELGVTFAMSSVASRVAAPRRPKATPIHPYSYATGRERPRPLHRVVRRFEPCRANREDRRFLPPGHTEPLPEEPERCHHEHEERESYRDAEEDADY